MDAPPPDVPADDVTITLADVRLAGRLAVPADARGIVVFAHGSGSSRHSPRNGAVAAHLGEAGLATLLFDLLTDAEAPDRAKVFDVDLLAGRLVGVVEWLSVRPSTTGLTPALFGASTGAAAALVASARLGGRVAAVVSRGGRPDLAGPSLAGVDVPTLLVVGGRDRVVLELNRQAAREIGGEHRVEIVPEATHLFEEPGALDQVAALARDWFLGHLPAPPRPSDASTEEPHHGHQQAR